MQGVHQAGSQRERRSRLFLPVSLLILASLWIVLVAGLPSQEAVLGAISAVLTTLFIFSMWRAQDSHVEWHARDVLEIIHVPAQIVHDALLIIGILVRDLLGRHAAGSQYIVYAFDASPSSPRKAAREVLAVTYMTASPNSIVLGIHPKRNLVLLHQLADTPLPAMMRHLGAGAQK